jgi:hypothetical protein
MLEAQKQSKEDWHAIMQAEEGCSPTDLLHERKVWLEKEGVVIVTNESIPVRVSVDGVM